MCKISKFSRLLSSFCSVAQDDKRDGERRRLSAERVAFGVQIRQQHRVGVPRQRLDRLLLRAATLVVDRRRPHRSVSGQFLFLCIMVFLFTLIILFPHMQTPHVANIERRRFHRRRDRDAQLHVRRRRCARRAGRRQARGDARYRHRRMHVKDRNKKNKKKKKKKNKQCDRSDCWGGGLFSGVVVCLGVALRRRRLEKLKEQVS
jgi:hypothetical protein